MDKELQREMERLRLEKKKNLKKLKQDKESIISEILNSKDINNTIQIEKNYSLWQRMKKTLGIN